MKTYKINGKIIKANKISDAIKSIKDSINDEDKYFRVRYGHEGDPLAWTSVVIVKANSEGEAARKFNNKWKGYKIFSVTEGAPEGVDEMKRRGMTVIDETEVDSCQDEDDLGDRIAKYQKWVDYDMEKYHKISEETMRMIKEAGLSVTKDQYGEYEVIAHSTEDSVDETGIVSQKLSTPRGTFYIYRGTYRDFRRESDFDDWGCGSNTSKTTVLITE